MTTLVMGTVGAAAGFAIGGPTGAQIGWSLGVMAGGALQGPTQLPGVQGPRLADLKAQSASYGNTLPIVFGRVAIAGTVIWSTDLVETATTTTVNSGGKGGGGGSEQQQTTYSYSVSCAVAICEGPITGIRKIWANGKLIYNVSDDAAGNTVLASSSAATIYVGSTTQTADPTIEAALGAGNVPGYRGTAYVVFNSLQLAEFGNRMPNFEFEVIKAGTTALGTSQYINGSGVNDTIQPETDITHSAQALYGEIWAIHYDAGYYLGLYSLYDGSRILTVPATDLGAASLAAGAAIAGVDAFNNCYARGGSSGRLNKVARNGAISYVTPATAVGGYGLAISDDGSTIWGTDTAGAGTIYRLTALSYAAHTCTQTAISGGTFNRFLRNALGISGRVYGQNGSGRIAYVNTTTLAYTEWPNIGALPSARAGVVGSDGYVYVATDSTTLGKYDAAGNLVDSVAIAGITGVDLFDSAGYVWARTASTAYKVVAGTMEIESTVALSSPGYSGIVGEFTPGVPVVFGTSVNANGRLGIIEPRERITVTASDLGNDVITDLCQRAGLTAGDIDVSELVGIDVDGYAITQRGSVRKMIEPLMGCFFFDAVESDDQIKFQLRGGSSLATIDDDDLGAHDGAIDAPQDLIKFERRQEMELPVEVNLIYFARDNQYRVAQQRARRLITEAKQTVTLNVGLALSDDHARQIVETMMYSAWLERDQSEFSTSRKFAQYEPGDILTVGSSAWPIRITEKSDGANGTIQWRGVPEDASIYTQTATGVAGETADDAIALSGPTLLVPLDMPLLRDADDAHGFYVAGAGYADGWGGSQIYRSTNGGTSYAALSNGLLLTAATLGRATTALGGMTDGRNDVFDESGTVTVELSSGELASATRAELFDGANVAALKSASGWEVFQFRTATLIAADTYTLSGLLRGRLGSEAFMNDHAIGGSFVLLDTDSIRSLTQGAADINRDYLYKGVTVGSTLAATPAQTFANTDLRKKPLAPRHVGGGRDASGNLSIHWKRRTRYQAPLVDGQDAPLGETTERYEVDILSGSTVLRTISATTPAADYTAAERDADFGSPTPSQVSVAVYQVSDDYGRGTAATATI